MQFKELGIADWAVEVDELPFGSEVAGVQAGRPRKLVTPSQTQGLRLTVVLLRLAIECRDLIVIRGDVTVHAHFARFEQDQCLPSELDLPASDQFG